MLEGRHRAQLTLINFVLSQLLLLEEAAVVSDSTFSLPSTSSTIIAEEAGSNPVSNSNDSAVYYDPIQFPLSALKRTIDILIALIASIVLAPVMLIIAILIRLNSKGPAIFKSLRAGKKGKPFVCYKFRSMVIDADEIKRNLLHLNYRSGATFKISNDPRTTRIGRFIRKYSLDELPQIWNVLLNDMSIVGPRPHPLDDVSRYPATAQQRHCVKPGLTGLWQIEARRDPSFERNISLDLRYINEWSLGLDLKIIASTFTEVVRGNGE